MATDGRARSGRKSLRDLSNTTKIGPLRSKISQERHAAVNRLSRAQSNLSDLLNEVEKVIARSASSNCKMVIQEIESLTDLCTQLYSSLKPWVQNCQQQFGRSFTATDHQINENLLGKDVSSVSHKGTTTHNTSENSAMDSLVISPSPLVSWKANCRVESGKQLFLLTPLPKSKLLSTKNIGSCKPRKSSSEITTDVQLPCRNKSLPPMLATIECPNHSISKVSEVDVDSNGSSLGKEKYISKLQSGLCFPPVPLNKESKPNIRLKAISPFKTCKLLEPTAGILQEDTCVSPEPSTAYFKKAGNNHCKIDSLSENASELNECFGFAPATVRRTVPETSLNWFLSPPKTCVLLDLTENVSTNPKSSPELPARQWAYASDKGGIQRINSIDTDGRLTNIAAVDAATPSWRVFRTPMLECPESSCFGKRNAGETTLKRELWARFDAVTSNGLRCSVSVFPKAKGSQFLERLDEASFEQAGFP